MMARMSVMESRDTMTPACRNSLVSRPRVPSSIQQREILMETESLFRWSRLITEFFQFIGAFCAIGAVGFHFAVARRLPAPASSPASGHSIHDHANRRAAIIGLIGVVIALVLLGISLPTTAAQRHIEVGQVLTSDTRTMLRLAFSLIALAGFFLALAGKELGWILTVIGVIIGRLQGVFTGQFGGLINSFHMLFGGLWIGTLLVLVVAGIAVVMRHEPARELRGPQVADMVNRFSPLALVSGLAVVLFGVITAWQHLNPLSALWTTPYGYSLIAKLVAVAVVFALGAWNWRRQRPRLGSEETAATIRKSSTAELSVALLVLVLTAVMLAFPSPRRPGAAPANGAPTPGATGGPPQTP
jgi:putative copper resistance protein D